MERVLSGVTHLVESDITDILKMHFARYGHGFKHITYAIDMAERDKPRFEIDLLLKPLNKVSNERVEKLYFELLSKCAESVNAEDEIMREVYGLVQRSEITSVEFTLLINKIKGQ